MGGPLPLEVIVRQARQDVQSPHVPRQLGGEGVVRVHGGVPQRDGGVNEGGGEGLRRRDAPARPLQHQPLPRGELQLAALWANEGREADPHQAFEDKAHRRAVGSVGAARGLHQMLLAVIL
eukprot:scaffold25204_cov39-Phaeocystis_antarctica.AAC.1